MPLCCSSDLTSDCDAGAVSREEAEEDVLSDVDVAAWRSVDEQEEEEQHRACAGSVADALRKGCLERMRRVVDSILAMSMSDWP